MSVDLIIGGASKSGTTALFDMLRQRDDFFLPDKKELHHFSWPFLKDTISGPGDAHVMAEIPQTLADYLGFFAAKAPGQLGVDISPSYLFHHGSAQAMARDLPGVKVAFILRRPDQKVYSQYVHLVGEGREALSFEAALQAEAERKAQGFSDMWLYRESGFYADAIARFQQALGPERVKVFLFDDFRTDPAAVLRDLCQFVGLDQELAFDTALEANVSGAPRSAILARIIAPNGFTRLLRRILPTSLGTAIRRAIRSANTGAKPEIDPGTCQMLRKGYEADITRLEALIGRPTGWRLPQATEQHPGQNSGQDMSHGTQGNIS